MATIRHHARIARPADEVWAVVKDAATISAWFPGIETSAVEGSTRTVTIAGAGELVEDIVTSDDALRRFQYRITGGAFTPEYHLGTDRRARRRRRQPRRLLHRGAARTGSARSWTRPSGAASRASPPTSPDVPGRAPPRRRGRRPARRGNGSQRCSGLAARLGDAGEQ